MLPSSESDSWSGSFSSPWNKKKKRRWVGYTRLTALSMIKEEHSQLCKCYKLLSLMKSTMNIYDCERSGLWKSLTSWVQKETPVERLFSRGRLRSRMERGWDLSSPSFSSSFLSISVHQGEQQKVNHILLPWYTKGTVVMIIILMSVNHLLLTSGQYFSRAQLDPYDFDTNSVQMPIQ